MYAEDLPVRCPPSDAFDSELPKVYRLLKTKDISDESFHSKAKLKEENRTNADPCTFASCSLVKDPVAQIRKYPKMRATYSHAAEMKIPAGAGKSDGKKYSNHVNFWPFKATDIKTMVIDVVELPEVSSNG